ncbi:MAG: DNA repair protein RecN [Chitinophagaceae bacterium]
MKRKNDALKEYDYFQFQFEELEEASFGEGEIETLETELATLTHAENLQAVLDKVTQLLDNGEQPVVHLLKSLAQQVEAASKWHPSMNELAARLRSTQIELQDIAGEAEQIAAGISNDEKRKDVVSERLSMAYRLLKKHQVKTTDELLKVKEHIAVKLKNVISLDEEIIASEKKLQELEKALMSSALNLSKGRESVRETLEKKVAVLLKQVGMPNASIKINITETAPGPAGTDNVDFLFDANKSGRFEPLKKVASGGELSRLLLCIKTLVAGSLEMPVMIFDEIDSGISGEAARQVGVLMKEMGRSHQIISITHQPQIAAKADAHYYVYKKEMDGAVRTQLKKLNEKERVESIAKMMSGEKLTESAMQNAREMME